MIAEKGQHVPLWQDIPDLKVDGDQITFLRTPVRVTVRENLSKSGNKYFTFLGQEGCMYL